MAGLGNKSFQGFGLPSDLARRLEDIARQVSTNQSNLDVVKAGAVTPAQAQAIANAAAQSAVLGPLNIANATGTAGSATIPTVTTLPPAVSSKLGQAVVFENDIWTFDGMAWAQSVTWLYADTHAHRPVVGDLVAGTLYVETDRLWIYALEGGAWVYIGGQAYPRTQAQLAALAATLGVHDVGAIVHVSDYDHRLMWTGSGWVWGDAGDRAGYVQGFLIDPYPTTGWHLCDGSLVQMLNADGTTTTALLPDTTSSDAGTPAYLKFAAATSFVVGPAVAPTASGTGTLSGNTNTASAGTPAGSVTLSGMGFSGGSDTTAANTSLVITTDGTGTTHFVAGGSHTHDFTPTGTVSGSGSFAGTAMDPHYHALTGSIPITVGISATGEPPQVITRAWFRQ